MTTIRKVVFTSPKEKMLRARASAERGERVDDVNGFSSISVYLLYVNTVRKVVFTSPKEKMLRARASAERGERVDDVNGFSFSSDI